MTSYQRGLEAEMRAARYLEAQGFEIRERRYAARHGGVCVGEIDLICVKEGRLSFVEVRARASSAYGTPAETVSASKRQKITRAAYTYLARVGGWEGGIGFDIIEICGDKLRFIQDAFAPEGGSAWL